MFSRRHFLGLCAATSASVMSFRAPDAAAGESATGARRTGLTGDLSWSELALQGSDHVTRRALILAPAHGPVGQRYPALLLLHGRGEVADAQAGIHAWRSRYGLASSYAQLRRPPLKLDAERSRFMRRAELAAINARLAQQPFAGLVLICPVTPNPHVSSTPERLLGDYADWIEHTLLPEVARIAPIDPRPCLGIDGCSLGGYVATEVLARKPHLFRTFGVVQPAFGEFRVRGLARQLARARAQPGFAGIHLQTSSEDPYRRATQALSRELRKLGAEHTLEVLRGPHTQRWLRGVGTLAMLAWHERMLHGALNGSSPS